MALPLSNTFEGGSNGVTVSTANSGGASGNAFDVVTTSDDFTYTTSTFMHGAVGATSNGDANAQAGPGWQSTSMGTPINLYGRFYMFRAATPSEQQRVVRWFNSIGGTEGGRISWHTDGKVYSFDSTLVVPPSSSFTLTANQWIRFEFNIFCDGSAGIIEVKCYVGDSTSEIGTYTRTGLNTLTQIGDIRIGSHITAIPGAWTIDDLALSDTGYIGPASSVTPVTGSVSSMAAIGF